MGDLHFMAILEARQISKVYTVDHRHIRVLDDVSLSVEAGEFVVITGSSGSGKTTLLTILSGLDQPNVGQVIIDNHDITGASEDDLARVVRAYGPEEAGYRVFTVSCETGEGIPELRQALTGMTLVMTGQSGTGKTSLARSITTLGRK